MVYAYIMKDEISVSSSKVNLSVLNALPFNLKRFKAIKKKLQTPCNLPEEMSSFQDLFFRVALGFSLSSDYRQKHSLIVHSAKIVGR